MIMKNGFTLIELLGVIIILGILATITIVSVNGIISDSKKSLTNAQKATIEKAAESYYLKEGINDNVTCVNVSHLKTNGYLNDDVIDLSTKQSMLGSVSITLSGKKYSFTYQEKDCSGNIVSTTSTIE